MKKLYLLFLFTNILCFKVQSQTESTDTLDLARKLISEKQFDEAKTFLSQYIQSTPNQYAYQILAQAEYWSLDFNKAEQTYQQAITLYPQSSELKLDYGRMLFEMGKYPKAITQLQSLKNNAEADIMLAKMTLWNGHVAKSRAIASQVLSGYPTNQDAKDLLITAKQMTPLYLKLGTTYISDDQPLTASRYEAEASWFKSYLFSPSIQFQQSNYTMPGATANTNWVRLDNTFKFGYGKTILRAGSGIFTSAQGTKVSSLLELTQKLSKSFSFNAGFQNNPYQYTIASIHQPLFQQTINTSINYNKSDKWLGSASYILQSYADGNQNYTAYVWFLGPLIQNKGISLLGGISSSYANSNENTFGISSSPSVLAESYGNNTQVPGIYSPYFTPSNQQVNALLASLKIPFSKGVTFYSHGSIGVFANTSNPNLTLMQTGSEYTVRKTYVDQKYTPIEAEGSLRMALSSKLILNALYRYSSLFFYTNNSGNLQLVYRIGE
jgi:tetratricopeptide (TPR) repeat protein